MTKQSVVPGAPRSSRPTQKVVLHVPGRAAAGRPYENVAEHVGRGGLWPPADPRRDAHHKGGRKIEMPPFPVPPAQAVTAGAGAPWGRKDAGRRPTPHSAPTLKSPFFFGFQKPFLFPAGKKKWVLKASLSSPHPERLPQSPSVTAPSEREPKGAPGRRAPHTGEPRPIHVILRPLGRRIRNPRPSAFLLRKRTGETDSSPSAQNDKEGTLRMTKKGRSE